MLSENDQKVNRITAMMLRIGTYIMIIILLLSYLNIIPMHDIEFFKKLVLASIILFMPTIIVDFLKLKLL